MTRETNNRGSAQGRALIVIGALVVVALIGVIIVLVMMLNRGENNPEQEEPRRAVLVTEDNVEEVIGEITAPEPTPIPASYEVSMTMDWIFPDGSSPSSNAYVENVAANTTDVYFDIMLRDTGEVLYESPVIPVGGRLENIRLDRALSAGTYRCIIEYHLVDGAQNTLGTVDMGLTITVQS